MGLGELIFGPSVNRVINQDSQDIVQAAERNGIDVSLIRAIIYEEQTHAIPIAESRQAERLGCGRTVGLGQITVGTYGQATTRENLLDPVTNINLVAFHLVNLREQLAYQGIANPTPAELATLYNCGSCIERSDSGYRVRVTNYGRRVQEFFIRYETQ
jgi:hypothetical protein